MRGGLFRRIFGAMTLAILLTVAFFTTMLATVLQNANQTAYENEVRLQAREIACDMSYLNRLSSLRDNETMKYSIRRKINDIHTQYNADIWIVTVANDSLSIQMLDSSWKTSETTIDESISEQLTLIAEGNEIRTTGLFPELGDGMVTIGVPWTYRDGTVVGAVLLHISTASLHSDPRIIVQTIAPVTCVSILIGVLLSAFIARRQTMPLREIDSAVREFSKGDLTRRVELHCGGELEALGNSINRMASELSQLEDSRRHFVAAVSHELRSPMTCMRGYVEAMLDGTIPPEELPHYLTIVRDETDRLTALVHDLLELSRFESGKFPLQQAPFNANDLVCRILVTFEPRISAKSIEVEAALSEAPCFAMGDAGRITQVISNFVDNAVKFLPEGGHLIVRTERVGKNVRFTVQNDGPVISEADLPHIFERFYKADKAHTSGMGTGLGLSICSLIIREHGSDISVHSLPGDTAFSFELPACSPPA